VPPGVNRLPLVLLANEETHSAAEQFAALLQDNRRVGTVATDVAQTDGAPAGYVGCVFRRSVTDRFSSVTA